MKKNLFILAAAALAFAACSNDELVEVNSTVGVDEISFRPLITNATRASEIEASTLQGTGFTVFATLEGGSPSTYFEETAFTYSSSTYISSPPYYWPSAGSLEFFAYANSKPEGHASQVSHTAQTKAFVVTPDANAQYQTDLVVACTTGKTKNGTYSSTKKYGVDGVPLNFRHAMTKVTIQLKNSSTNLHFVVSDVVLGNVFTAGTYTYSGSTNNVTGEGAVTATNTDATTGQWLKYDDWTERKTGEANTQTGSYTQTASTTAYAVSASAVSLTNSMILIPQTLTNASAYSGTDAHVYPEGETQESAGSPFEGSYITVQIKVLDASDHYVVGSSDAYVTALWPLPATKWLPGYHYTYTVDLAGGGYYPDNQDTNTDLDPILEGAEIKFVDVTVDSWNNQTAIDVIAPPAS